MLTFEGGEDQDTEQDSTEESSEETQDTSEENTESEDTESSENEETEETEEGDAADKTILFMDPSTLPEELKPAFVKMQGSFTRKMQAAAAVLKKADAFDNVIRMPGFKEFIEAQQNGTSYTPPAAKRAPESAGGKGSRAESPIRKMIREELQGIVGPVKEKVENRELREEFETFKSKYPFYKNFEPQLREVLSENPHWTYEQALSVVAFPELLKAAGGSLKLKHKAKKEINSTTKPNRSSFTESPPPSVSTVQEAWALAKKQLAAGKR